MKISNSKKQLAQIIHENGGWRGGAEWAAQDKNPLEVGFWLASKKPNREPWPGGIWVGDGWSGSSNSIKCAGVQLVENWHQTVLSRDEYFFLYQNQGLEDALDEPMVEAAPTIEQLAAYYRNCKDYADRKQQEADAAKADAEAKLAELVAAGKALGLVLRAVEQEPEPELVITDWRDLQIGDVIEYVDGDIKNKIGMSGPVVEFAPAATDGMYVRLKCDNGPNKGRLGWPRQWRFIRRPSKGDANA